MPGGTGVQWDGTNFWGTTTGGVKKKLGNGTPQLIVNKVAVTKYSNVANYIAGGDGYIIVIMSSWSNSATTFTVTKNGVAIPQTAFDGVSDRQKYLYCWSIPIIKGDAIIATVKAVDSNGTGDYYLNMFAII